MSLALPSPSAHPSLTRSADDSQNNAYTYQKDDIVVMCVLRYILNHLLPDNQVGRRVTGLAGSGKSTFINSLLREPRLQVGETLNTTTTRIQHVIIEKIPASFAGHPQNIGHRLVVVDTPGLNSRMMDDRKILLDIVHWLSQSRVHNIAGVLYLYDIFQERYTSISKLDLAALRVSFQSSDRALSRFVLVTTKWNGLDYLPGGRERGEKREEELKNDFWRDLVNRGSVVQRFDVDDINSGWNIISALLSRHADNFQDPDIASRLKHLSKLLKNKQPAPFTPILEFVHGLFLRIWKR